MAVFNAINREKGALSLKRNIILVYLSTNKNFKQRKENEEVSLTEF